MLIGIFLVVTYIWCGILHSTRYEPYIKNFHKIKTIWTGKIGISMFKLALTENTNIKVEELLFWESYHSTDSLYSINSAWYRDGNSYEKYALRFCAKQNKTAQFYVYFNLYYENLLYQVEEDITKEIIEFDNLFFEEKNWTPHWKFYRTPKLPIILVILIIWGIKLIIKMY